jgi:hypothetical protein
MAQGKEHIDGTEERSLLSLARWVDEPAPARAGLLDALARRETARPAPQASPLIAALAKSEQREPAPAAAPLPARRAAAGPTLFDMLRAGKPEKATPAPVVAAAAAPRPAAQPVAENQPIRRSVAARVAPPAPKELPPAGRRLPRGALLALPIAGALAGAGAGHLIAGPDLHAAKAELVLKPAQVRAAQGQPTLPTERPALPADAVALAMARATAPDVLGAVVDRLSLAGNPEFSSGDRDAAMSTLAGRLAVAQQQLTPGFTVTASSQSPQLAGDIANAVADTLVETHDADAAGPPPTEMLVAFRALPGTGDAVPQSWIKTAAGAGAGALAGLLLMPLAGAAWRRRPARAADRPRVEAAAEPGAQRGAVPARAAGAKEPQHAAGRASAWDRLRASASVAAAPPARAAAEATPKARVATAPASAPAFSRETNPSIPTPEQDAVMYQQQPHPYWQPAQPQPDPVPTPQQAAWQQVAWQQPPAAPYPPMHAPQAPMPAHALHHPLPQVQTAPQAAPTHGYWPAPAQMAPAPMHHQPHLHAPAFHPQPHPAAYPPAQNYMPMQQAAMNPAAYAGQMQMPMPAPHYPQVVHHIHTMQQMPAPVAQATTIDHREAARPQPSRPVAVAAADAQSEETLSAIDELRAKLRAFAGTLDALRSARSA